MPSLRELLEAKKKDQELQQQKELDLLQKAKAEAKVKAIEKPLEKPSKSPIIQSRKEVKPEGIPKERFEPTSDHMRTAYFLLTGRSSRGTIAEIKQQLRIILDQMEAKQEAKLKTLTQ